MNDQAKNNELRQGAVLLVILVAVNAIEYWFALVVKSPLVLYASMILLAAIDSGLIIAYYMHLPRVFGEEDPS